MRRIKWTLNIGLAGCEQGGVVELEDNVTDEEIEEILRQEVFDPCWLGLV